MEASIKLVSYIDCESTIDPTKIFVKKNTNVCWLNKKLKLNGKISTPCTFWSFHKILTVR